MYDYFKIGESEQYHFLQLPWLLIKDAQFKRLSDSSKILYSLLLNRTNLSAKKGYVDEDDNIYIIYTIEQIMEDLCCATEKATKTLKELKDIGLIKSVRRGLGKPNLIYVMNFATSLKYQSLSQKTPITSLNFENRNSGISEIEIQDFRKSKCSNTDMSNTDMSNTESESTSDDLAEIKNDMTMTHDVPSKEEINIENNKAPIARQAEATYKFGDFSQYEQIIKANIEYDHYATYNRTDIEMIDGLVGIMLDVICTQAPDTVKIGKETKSRDIVKSVYLKLNSSHIDHIISQFKDQHHKITHKTAYLRTMLYTVGQEFDAHYTNQVRADGVV